MIESRRLDLIVLVADADAEAGIKALLEKRTKALGIRDLRFKVIRHPGRDAGVYQQAPTLLRSYLSEADYALVLFDYEGCGKEGLSAQDIENDVEERLKRNGWATERHDAAVIVLDPELEVWVWTNSPHVAHVAGLSEERLHALLDKQKLASNGKPERPKETWQEALRQARTPLSPALYQQLAEKVSLQGHQERAFTKLRDVLQTWFG